MIKPSLEDFRRLVPQTRTLSNGNNLYLFPSDSAGLLKLDFLFEAGTAYQKRKLCAGVAKDLFSEGTRHHTAQQLSEFMDFRGIVINKGVSTYSSDVSVYLLPKYADELFPLLAEMMVEPEFPQADFDVLIAKRRQMLLSGFQKTSYVARNLFYEALFGFDHPEGGYAMPGDESMLSIGDVRRFFSDRYHLGAAVLSVSGTYNEQILKCYDECFGCMSIANKPSTIVPPPSLSEPIRSVRRNIPNAVQSSLRVGGVLPYAWDDSRFSQYQVLDAILGGYFGSRLMSNLREDKGYTYGIYSMPMMLRGITAWMIQTDVGAEHTEDALKEIYHEMDVLTNDLVSDEELEVVRNYLAGDFLRSIDGIFERSERFVQMQTTGITERYTENYFEALESVSPRQLRDIAQQVYDKQRLTEIVVGP